MHTLEKISIRGFRSIKELPELTLGPITVLVGANGSGKSNLIGFFRMLNAVVHGGLSKFVEFEGRASTLLHYGPEYSRIITGSLTLRSDTGLAAYRFEQTFAAVDRLIFTAEEVRYQQETGAGAQILSIKNPQPAESALSRDLDPMAQLTETFIKRFLDKVRVFHFEDTSIASRMRNFCDRDDSLFLRANGGNLAAVLLRLRHEFPGNFRRVVAGVNTIFPELQDFHLEPTTGNGNSLLLSWEPASHPAEVFGTAHLSDGTLRMIALVTLFNLPAVMAPWMIILDEPELGLHPAAEIYLASLIRSVSTHTQVLLGPQSATLLDHFKSDEVVVAEMRSGASIFHRLDQQKLDVWLKRYSLGEAWRKEVLGGFPE